MIVVVKVSGVAGSVVLSPRMFVDGFRVVAPVTRSDRQGGGLTVPISSLVRQVGVDGVIEFDAEPGPCVLVLLERLQLVASVELLVPDEAGPVSLERCFNAALVTGDSEAVRILRDLSARVFKARDDSELYAKAAKDSSMLAEEFASNALLAQHNAEGAQGRAETARQGAETARQGAESERNKADAARKGAEAAKNGADAAKTAAGKSAGEAKQFKEGAENAVWSAANEASKADAARKGAEAANTSAQDAKTAAEAARDAANKTVNRPDYSVDPKANTLVQRDGDGNIRLSSEYVGGDNAVSAKQMSVWAAPKSHKHVSADVTDASWTAAVSKLVTYNGSGYFKVKTTDDKSLDNKELGWPATVYEVDRRIKNHTHTSGQITDAESWPNWTDTSTYSAKLVRRIGTGQIQVPDTPYNGESAVNKNYLDKTLDNMFGAPIITVNDSKHCTGIRWGRIQQIYFWGYTDQYMFLNEVKAKTPTEFGATMMEVWEDNDNGFVGSTIMVRWEKDSTEIHGHKLDVAARDFDGRTAPPSKSMAGCFGTITYICNP